ncbi:MAG TPA: tetratricopeptide repeat protein [Bacteroidota bacterium]|nr:tetratricopeptide repeat protein [Bacteroidota bacterium]
MRIGLLSIVLFFAVLTECAAQNTKENADFKLAVNLFSDKLYDLSLEQFKQFISTYPSSPQSVDAKYYVALAERALKKDDDARVAFQNFAITYPEHPKAAEAWWNIGEIYRATGKLADAASAFERIKVFQSKSPLAPKALLTAGDLFLRSGDADDAKRCLKSLISDYPTDENVTAAHAQLGSIYLKENNTIAAQKELQTVTESGGDPDVTATATLQLASIAESSGNPDEAERLYKSIVDEKKSKVSPATVGRARLLLSRFYFSVGKQSEGTDLLQKLCADSTRIPRSLVQESLLELGKNSFSQGEFKKSAAAFERSLEYPVDSSLVVSALFGAGRAYDMTREYKRSFLAYTTAADHLPSGPDKRTAILRTAVIASDLKNPAAALQYYQECLDLFPSDPESPEILYRIAELEGTKLNEPQKATELYEEFLSRHPQDGRADDAAFALATTYESLHENSDAVKAYAKVLRNYPSSPMAPEAEERKEFLEKYQSSDKEETVKQLALLIGDLILEKNRAELAVRLGDIYLNVLQDFPEAALQYQKAESVSKDTSLEERAEFGRTLALTRECSLDSSATRPAIDALTTFLKRFPLGKNSDEAAYTLLRLKSEGATASARIQIARDELAERPGSTFTPQVLLALGKAQKDKGLLGESIETYKRIVSEFPLRPEAEEASADLGLQLASLGRDDTAAVVLSEYLREYPRGFYCAEVLYEIGIVSARGNKPLLAATSFEQLRSKYPYSPRAADCLEPLAQCYRNTAQYPRAVDLCRQLIREASSPLRESAGPKPGTILLLAQTYDAAQDTADAEAAYKQYVTLDARSADASVAYARLAAYEQSRGRDDVAVRYLEKSVSATRGVANSAALASLCFASGDYERAIAEYGALVELSNVDSASAHDARVKIITALLRSDKNSEAEKRIGEFAKTYPGDKNAAAEFEFEKAMSLYRAEELDRALAAFRLIQMKFDSTEIFPLASFWVGKVLEAKELPDSALVQYDRILKSSPRSDVLPKVYLAEGNIYFYKEKYDDAVKYYRLIVDKPDLSPEVLPFAMSNLIEAYKELALYDGALELTRTFIEKYPNDESILDKKVDLGILYQKLGYYDQAIVQLEGLLETTNKDFESEIRYYLGESYFDKGDYQQAILEFLKVPYLISKKTKIDWTPNSYYMSAQSYEKMGKFDQALNMYQQIIDKPGIDPAFKTAAQKEINRVKSLVKKDNN